MIDVTHDSDHGRAVDLDHACGVFEEAFDGFVLELLFDGDDGGVGTELTGYVLHQFTFERLVDGYEDAAHQQGGDEVFAADVELLGKVLDADALGDRDGTGNGQGLARDGRTAKTRRRLEALHGAFFGLLVALATAALARTGRWTRAAWGLAGSRQHAWGAWCAAWTCTEAWARAEAGTCSAWSEAGTAWCSAGAAWKGASGVHRTASARSE